MKKTRTPVIHLLKRKEKRKSFYFNIIKVFQAPATLREERQSETSREGCKGRGNSDAQRVGITQDHTIS